MLDLIILLCVLLWLGGFGFNGYGMGSLVHLLIVVACVVLVYRLLVRGRVE